MTDTVRVLRIMEYTGPRDLIEKQMMGSLRDGTHDKIYTGGVELRIATVGQYPEVLEDEDD